MSARGDTFLGWQLGPGGGHISESNGTLIFSANDVLPGKEPSLFKEFTPKGDFEISFQLKAETLGEVLLDQAGEGFSFLFGNIDIPSQQFHIVSLNMRARAGGQFLLNWHDNISDLNGWQGQWIPFVYNGLEYNNGYAFWHTNPPQDRSNAPIQPDVWYTLKLKVQKTPFLVTGEVYSENDTMLGSLTIGGMNDFTFEDIKYVYMRTGGGGTFYVRNIKGLAPDSSFTLYPNEAVVSNPVAFTASENASSYGQALNYTWDFGDGNVMSTEQPVVSHIYQKAGSFNVTLTVADSEGSKSSSSRAVRVWQPTCLSVSTDTSSSTVGSAVNINGRLTDRFGTGLANEPVAVYYTFAGADSWYPISSDFTNEAGEYSVQWMSVASGTFTLRAQWSGNATYLAANTTTTLSSLPIKSQNVLFVESNSTVTSLAFNSSASELSFTVSGTSGTTGYVKATIAKSVLPDAQDLKVNLDGNQLNYTLSETADAWLVTFNYHHSTHHLTIYLPTPVVTATEAASVSQSPSPSPMGVENWTWIVIIAGVGLIIAVIAGGIGFRRRK
jgi:PKD repeat protein